MFFQTIPVLPVHTLTEKEQAGVKGGSETSTIIVEDLSDM